MPAFSGTTRHHDRVHMRTTLTGEMVDSLILGGVFFWCYLAAQRIWNKSANKRKATTMTRQSPHRQVWLEKALTLALEDPETQPILAELYFLASMDGRHAQLQGYDLVNPLDRLMGVVREG